MTNEDAERLARFRLGAAMKRTNKEGSHDEYLVPNAVGRISELNHYIGRLEATLDMLLRLDRIEEKHREVVRGWLGDWSKE